MIQRRIMLDLTPTPEELAFEFSHMGDGDQAAFFNELARLTALWDHPLCFQLQYVTDSKILTAAGRGVMRMIGEYADENPPII